MRFRSLCPCLRLKASPERSSSAVARAALQVLFVDQSPFFAHSPSKRLRQTAPQLREAFLVRRARLRSLLRYVRARARDLRHFQRSWDRAGSQYLYDEALRPPSGSIAADSLSFER